MKGVIIMVTEIRYLSKGGHTKEVADCIGKTLDIEPEPIDKTLPDEVDLLFLGGAFYFMHPARELDDFIESLDPKKIKAVAVFSTTGGPEDASKSIGKECKKHGLNVLDDEFHCTDHELKNDETLKKAAEFAKKALADAQKQ